MLIPLVIPVGVLFREAMPTPTVENYLKQILLISQETSQERVPMGLLADRMAVVPGTATTMVKSLQQECWVQYIPRVGVQLTEIGREEAVSVLRKHRIIEMFLFEVLNLDWAEIHEEAEKLEHAISINLLEKMEAYLNFPDVDPHGDPIPRADGTFSKRTMNRLIDTSPDKLVTIAQITRQDSSFLQFLNTNGLIPGARIKVERYDATADVVHIVNESESKLTLGSKAASDIFVSDV